DAGLVLDGVAWERVGLAALEPGQWVVFDSYRPLGVHLPGSVRLVWFEDVPGAAPPVAPTITVSSAHAIGPGRRLLHGERYACLRPSYWGLPTPTTSEEVGRVLVATGSGDPLGGGAAAAAAVARALPEASV